MMTAAASKTYCVPVNKCSAAPATQAAVSMKLQRLESVLGKRLVERSPRAVTLTAQGSAFLPHARALIEAHDRALSGETPARQTLSLGISDHAAGPELVAEICAAGRRAGSAAAGAARMNRLAAKTPPPCSALIAHRSSLPPRHPSSSRQSFTRFSKPSSVVVACSIIDEPVYSASGAGFLSTLRPPVQHRRSVLIFQTPCLHHANNSGRKFPNPSPRIKTEGPHPWRLCDPPVQPRGLKIHSPGRPQLRPLHWAAPWSAVGTSITVSYIPIYLAGTRSLQKADSIFAEQPGD